MERQTTLTIESKQVINLSSPAGKAKILVRDGKLYLKGSELRLTAEKMAEVKAALAAHRPAQVVHTSAPSREPQYEWEFCGVENDAYGVYSRVAAEAINPVVMIGKLDLV